MLTQKDMEAFERGEITPDRLMSLQHALASRADTARHLASGDIDERYAASLRGKAKGYWEAMQLVNAILNGKPMKKPGWLTR